MKTLMLRRNRARMMKFNYEIISFPHTLSLEKLFNRHDAYIKIKRVENGPTTGEYEGENIGDTHDPKMINIGKCCSTEEKEAAK